MSGTPTTRQQRMAVCASTLLVLALVGGSVGVWTSSALRQRHTTEAVIGNSIGNWVYYTYELDGDCERTSADPPGSDWLRERLGIDFFATVGGAKIEWPSESTVELLASFGGLRSVDLTGTVHQRNFDLRPLQNVPGLEWLALRNVKFLGDRLAVLARLPRLHVLILQSCEGAADDQFDFVGQLADLKHLVLIDCHEPTNAGLAKLARLKNLETLSLHLTEHTTDDVLKNLADLARLRRLSIYYKAGSEPATGLEYLASFASLEDLTIDGANDEALAAAGIAPKVKELSLGASPALGEVGLRNIVAFPNVERLTLWLLPALDDAALAHVARLSKLRELSIFLYASLLTDASLTPLAELKQLEKLHITFNESAQFSSEAIERLRARLPGCEIRYQAPSKAP